MKIIIPKIIKYGGVEYNVIFDDTAIMQDSWGLYSYGLKTIVLNPKLAQPEETLFHELGHMVARHNEFSHILEDKDLREVVENFFGKGFYEIIVNNPQLFKQAGR